MIRKLNFFFILVLLSPVNFPLKSWAVENFKQGEILFASNCSVCHLGGNNIIIPEKNLKKQTLEENGMNSVSAITYQIMNGKNGMPAFGGRLNEIEMEGIATYLLDQAEKNF